MIYLWVSLFLIVWTLIGCVRFFMLLGYKGSKESLIDKILLTPVMPLAILLGFILYILEKIFDK